MSGQALDRPEIVHLGFKAGANGNNVHIDFRNLPFAPQRLFMMLGMGPGSERGNHAHSTCAQLFIASAGACTILLDDLATQMEIRVSRPDIALFVPPLVWVTARDFTPDAVITVLSSEAFNPDGMIDCREKLRALRTGPDGGSGRKAAEAP